MTTNPNDSYEVFCEQSQILSCWPAGIFYNSSEDKYTYSVSSNWKITPRSHLHVLDIDGPIGLGPYTLTIQLPIINQLPFASRLYFFLLSNSQDQDVLSFIPTTGSGDVVNGSPFSTSFTSTGKKSLFIAIAVGNSYIIHEFGAGYVPPAAPFSFPCNSFLGVPHTGPLTYVPKQITFAIQSVGSIWWGYSSNSYNPVPDPKTYYPGMDGYIVPQDAMTVTGFDTPGFKVTHSGRYRITANVGPLYYTLSSPFATQNETNRVIIANLSAAGATLDIAYGTTFYHNGASTSDLYYEGSVSTVMELDADTYVAVWTTIQNGEHLAVTGQAFTDTSKITFEFLNDYPLPPTVAPLALARSLLPDEIESPMHATLLPHVVADMQIKQAGVQKQQTKRLEGSNFTTSFSASVPSITLSDVEKIVQKALANEPPLAKKRRITESEGEKEIL